MKLIDGPSWQIILQPFQEYSKAEQTLLLSAWHARQNAYAFYSDYKVGAAVRSVQSGRVYPGCNVESATYSETVHAEENAIQTMICAEGPSVTFDAIAIVCVEVPLDTFVSGKDFDEKNPLSQLVMPCGRCRQVIWEHCESEGPVKIFSALPNGYVASIDIKHLYPVPFSVRRTTTKTFASQKNRATMFEAL
jgi:cytidine deaminase